MDNKYGVRYAQADKNGAVHYKEKFFEKSTRREKFVNKVSQEGGFLYVDALLDPDDSNEVVQPE